MHAEYEEEFDSDYDDEIYDDEIYEHDMNKNCEEEMSQYLVEASNQKRLQPGQTLKLGHGHFMLHVPEGFMAEVVLKKMFNSTSEDIETD